MTTTELIYLDHAATTPLDPRVFQAMQPYFLGEFGNAASRQHALGQRAAAAVEKAREQLAALLGADPREIVFTSGATEANNLALKGILLSDAYAKAPAHAISGQSEHHAVLDPLASLEAEQGFKVTRLAVDAAGQIDLAHLREALESGARLVSLMLANNEVGSLHPIAEIGALCAQFGVLLHSDATQAVGKLAIDVKQAGMDCLSLSAHKFGGPKGVGALYLSRKRPRVRCRALLDGGGHERGMRSGTLNVPGIVGLGAAAEIAAKELEGEGLRVGQLRDFLERELSASLPGVQRNSFGEQRLPNIANLSFEGIDAESFLTRLTRVAASSSSACTSASLQPSHVLRALGLDEARIASSVRFSLGRSTTEQQIQAAIGDIQEAVQAEHREGARDLCS
jgi:cysteine desulfurase